MIDKAKLEKIKKLADKMYDAAFKLTTDASLLRKAMDDYHQFIIHEYHKEEPVSGNIDFEQELYKAFGQVKNFTLCMQIAKRFYDMGKNNGKEPISGELEKAAEQDVCEVVNCCSATKIPNDHIPSWVQDAMVNEFIHGAQWQKEQMITKAVDAELLEGHLIRQKGVTHPLHAGDKVKIIVIKED